METGFIMSSLRLILVCILFLIMSPSQIVCYYFSYQILLLFVLFDIKILHYDFGMSGFFDMFRFCNESECKTISIA